MALGRAFSVAVRGLDGTIVEIEADVTPGLPGVHLVGLPDAALQESRDRVRAAVTNCGNSWPMSRLTLALSPATLPKTGSLYDIALACAVLSAGRKKPWHRLEKTVLLGELALDGRVRPVHGVLPAVLAAKHQGWPVIIVPSGNLAEASLVDGIEVLGVNTLRQLQHWLDSGAGAEVRTDNPEPAPAPVADLADIVGQTQARFAVEVAAAGAHHLMLTGPPGVGKTMLAQRLPGLLPDLTDSEALEVTAVHSVAGLLSTRTPLVTRPPFIAPHHSSSVAALVGGGSGLARPGAISRAHRGVLFLDECAEIRLSALEALRTPLEDGEVRLARVTRLGSSWCWRPTRVPVRALIRGTASARRWTGAAIWASFRDRCSTGLTCGCICTPFAPVRSPRKRPRAATWSGPGWRKPVLRPPNGGAPTGSAPTPKSPAWCCVDGSGSMRRSWRH